jgi:hypothetical protein
MCLVSASWRFTNSRKEAPHRKLAETLPILIYHRYFPPSNRPQRLRLPDRPVQHIGGERLLRIVADALQRLDVRLDAKSIRAIRE